MKTYDSNKDKDGYGFFFNTEHRAHYEQRFYKALEEIQSRRINIYGHDIIINKNGDSK